MAVRTRHKLGGPGLADWLVVFASTVLIAANLQTLRDRGMMQTASSYYFDSPWVPQIHTTAIVLDGALFVLAAVWLLTRFKKAAEGAMAVFALSGFCLCWVELVYALRLESKAVYVLNDLPFQPINNVGVLGAQVFGSYLLLKSPSGSLRGWKAWAVKGALCVGLWFFQAVVWQLVLAR